MLCHAIARNVANLNLKAELNLVRAIKILQHCAQQFQGLAHDAIQSCQSLRTMLHCVFGPLQKNCTVFPGLNASLNSQAKFMITL